MLSPMEAARAACSTEKSLESNSLMGEKKKKSGNYFVSVTQLWQALCSPNMQIFQENTQSPGRFPVIALKGDLICSRHPLSQNSHPTQELHRELGALVGNNKICF